MDQGPQGKKVSTRDIVGEASGFGSGRTYARAEYFLLMCRVLISKRYRQF